MQKLSWNHLFNELLKNKATLIKANVIAILATLALVPVPLLLPLLVDEVLLNHPGHIVSAINHIFPESWHGAALSIISVAVLTMLLRIISTLFGVWNTHQFTLIAKDISYQIRQWLLDKMDRVSLSEYEVLGSGSVSSRFVTDINSIDMFLGVSISRTLIAALSLVGVSIVLLLMHWPLALFVLILNPIVIYFTTVLGRRVKHLKRKENSAVEIFQQALTETLDAIHELRATNQSRQFFGQVRDLAKNVRDHSAAFSWKSDAANRLSFLVFIIGFEMFRAVAMLMVVFSDLSIGQMMAIFGYLWFMMSPVQEILAIQYSYHAANAAIGRLNSLHELAEETNFPPQQNPFEGRPTVSITLEDVSFAYRDDEQILSHTNLHIKAGEKVALVGASGAGKTTVAQVLLGLYEANQGVIRFDGIPVNEIGYNTVRENVAIVLQQPMILNDSLRMNLTLGRNISDEAIWQALEIAQLRELVTEMPQGLASVLGWQGVRLSGGQKQRLAIARMILRNPKVVILDEATSALDTDTEAKLHQAMGAFLQGRTTLIIAHRLSAVRQADRALVFENGQVIEDGQHEALIAQDGLYAQLYAASE
ncbi:MAG: ABC transporter ATP-binding protein [Proteobacteria bacterium]|nr:MAG: ABC transporter ATP-binding protein [Pseudomonadota bacterium]